VFTKSRKTEEIVIQYFIIKRETLLHILTCKRSIVQ